MSGMDKTGALAVLVLGVVAAGCGSDATIFGDPSSAGAGAGGSGGEDAGGGGHGGNASASGGAGGSVCAVGAEQSCYGGPPGTEGVGICTAGVALCLPDGSGFGPCIGDVVPGIEDCATEEDDDCDGSAPPCTGHYLFSRQLKGGSIRVEAVTHGPLGDILVSGMAQGSSVDLGGGTLSGVGGALIARYDAGGGFVYGHVFGTNMAPRGRAIASDASGNAIVAGEFSGTLDFGGTPLVSINSDSAFVVKLDPGGGHLWSRSFGTLQDQHAYGVAVDDAGNVVVIGDAQGEVDFGGGPVPSGGGRDVFLVKLDPAGNHLFSKCFGDASDQYGTDVVIDAAGNIILTGYFYGSVSFGGPTLTNPAGSSPDGFVVKLDPNGNHLFSRHVGGIEQESPTSVAVDGGGNVVVAGFFDGTLELGGGPLVAVGSYDGFVGKLDPNGQHLFSRRFGGAQGQTLAQSVATGAGGSLVVTGFFSSEVDFGGGLLFSQGGDDIFVAKLEPIAGSHVWSKRFGSTGTDWSFGAASNAAGEAVIVGMFANTVSFGGPAFTAAFFDGFIAKYAP
jgi:hypothetical protein